MRKNTIKLMLLLFGVSLLSYSQNTVVQLDKNYGGASFDDTRNAVQAPDGGYYVFGHSISFSSDSSSDFYLVKTDALGTEQWSKTYDSDNADSYYHEGTIINPIPTTSKSNQLGYSGDQMQLTQDGGIIMAGTSAYNIVTAHPQDFRGFPYIVKTDLAGNVIWEKIYSGNSIVKNIESIQEVTGGYVISGRSTEGGNSAFFLKVDYNGNVLWETINHLDGSGHGSDVAEMNSGNILATSFSLSRKTFLLELNPNTGAVESSRRILDEGFDFWVLDIEKVSDGFALIGRNWTLFNRTNAAKLNVNGQFVWTKDFTNTELANTGGYSIKEDNNGNYIVGGFKINSSNLELALINISANDGAFNWIDTFGTTAVEIGTSVSIANDGNYIVTRGTEGLSSSSNMRFLKMGEINIPGYIEGQAFIDNDADCLFSSGDYPVANKIIQAVGSQGVYQVLTDNDGRYKLTIESSDYLVSLAPIARGDNYNLNINCSTTGNYSVFVQKGQTVLSNDFVLLSIPPPGGIECEVNLVSETGFIGCEANPSAVYITPCPDEQYQYCLSYTNTGDMPILPGATLDVSLPGFTNGSINVTSAEDTPVDFTEHQMGAPAQSDLTIITGNIIPVGGSFTYCITLTIDPNNPGPYFLLINGPNLGGENLGALCDSVNPDPAQDACACDPNDMQVSPKGCGEFGNIYQDQKLTYTVRFQNIGSGAAHNVVITDVLDDNLDLSSIRLVNSTHTVTSFQINPNNELVVSFEGIELNPIQEAPLNNGNVVFSVYPKSNLPEGTVITNQASIIFDSNEPVITNEVLNTVYTDPSVTANFTFEKQCASFGFDYDFSYTGESTNVTYAWDFGANTIPSISSDETPVGVTFTEGTHDVTLTVTKNGCSDVIVQSIVVSDIASSGKKKVTVCHNGQSITINKNALQAHLNHGDCVGACDTTARTTNNKSSLINEITLYPNPTSNSLTVRFDDLRYDSIEIIDISGRIVIKQTVTDKSELTLNVSSLSKGIYFMTILSNTKEVVIKKFIKN